MHQHLGKRVLVTVGENDAPRMTCVNMVSPNGLYVCLRGDGVDDEFIGWTPVATTKVVDVIGPETESRSTYMRRCYLRPGPGWTRYHEGVWEEVSKTFLQELATLRDFLTLLEDNPCELNVVNVEQAAKSVAYCARQLEVSHG